jgi:ParB family transcriptional regulator, chromosome partitioning protein
MNSYTDFMAIKIQLNQIANLTLSIRSWENPKDLKRLAEAIKNEGDVREPIVVKERINPKKKSDTNPRGIEYVVILGKRRRDAALIANLSEISAEIWDISDEEARLEALMDNFGREDNSDIDKTTNIMLCLQQILRMSEKDLITFLSRMRHNSKKLRDMLGGEEAGAPTAENVETIINLFKRLGWVTWQSFITSKLPMLKYPHSVKTAMREKIITSTNAKLLAEMNDEKRRDHLIEQVKHKKLKNADLPGLIGIGEKLGTGFDEQTKRIKKLFELKVLVEDNENYLALTELLTKLELDAASVVPPSAIRQPAQALN